MDERSFGLELVKEKNVFNGLSEEISNKGFLVAKYTDLVNWARSGSLWPMSFG